MDKQENLDNKSVSRLVTLSESDPELKKIIPDPAVRDAVCVEGLPLDRMIQILFSNYDDRPALGERSYDIVTDDAGKHRRSYLPAFNTVSYAELLSRIEAVASAWRHHSACLLKTDEFVCTIGFSGIEFFILDTACIFTQTVAVPMQTTMAETDRRDVYSSINPVIIAATLDALVMTARDALELDGVRALIVFDYDARDDNDREQYELANSVLSEAGSSIQLLTFAELIEFGKAKPWEYLPQHSDGENRMVSIVHSSGSTGKPKGAINNGRFTRSIWQGISTNMPIVSMGLAPLNHLLGRNSLFSALSRGGTLFFTLRPDMSTLLEDIRLARPTHMTLFPRVLEMAYQHYLNEVAKGTQKDDADEQATRERVMSEMRYSYFGDRLCTATVGGAPTPQSIKDFIRDCFGIKLVEGYGNTESGGGGITIDGVIQRPPVLEYKLRDVPELGYYLTDKPYPRGELCVKTVNMISGYYKQPEVTAELFDEQGFLLTGDIVEESKPDHLTIIDRRKDVLKLSQGEYVAVGNLGPYFEAGSAAIKQIYIYGNSHRAYLLAVVVPDEEGVRVALGEDASEAEIKNLIRGEMQVVAREKDLKSFEVPRDFILENEPWTPENGLLTSIRKRKRPALLAKYGDRLEAIYEKQDQAQEEQLLALKDPDSPLSVSEKLGKLLEAHLKIEGVDVSQPRTFAELGGDSLGAVIFSTMINEIFNVTVPADAILSPTGTPTKWAQMIEDMLSGTGVKPTFSSVHGKDAEVIRASDLTLDKFLGDELLAKADNLGEPAKELKTVLLTGGNGFLGHIACIDWMEKLAPKGGKLICLIRGADNATAKSRLDQEFAGLDSELEQRYQELAKDHLEVLAGDAGETYLGLNQEDFDRLASEVDRVCHIAALVNHRLGYEHMFGPNVVGTAEIIRLAITGRLKPVDFVSSEAVVQVMESGGTIDEDTPLLKEVRLTDNYAAGYGATKWAGEILLQEANRRFKLPVNTFRGDMMLAHQHYKGQMNATDMFTRLLYSIIVTGLAPHSFYKLAADGSKVPGHYNGTPVDMVSASVVNVADIDHSEYRNYNLENYHYDDGCSLDAFVDWIEAAGYPITRVDNYDDWFSRFKDKLNTLPEEQRANSSLDILGPFTKPRAARSHHVGCDRFKALVEGFNGGEDLPHLDQQFINKCLGDMKVLGLLG